MHTILDSQSTKFYKERNVTDESRGQTEDERETKINKPKFLRSILHASLKHYLENGQN